MDENGIANTVSLMHGRVEGIPRKYVIAHESGTESNGSRTST